MRSRLRDAAGLLVVLVVLLASFQVLVRHPHGILLDGERPSVDHASRPGSRGVGNDLTLFWLPKFEQVARQLRLRGQVPWWDTTGFAGRPFLGNPQSGQFYLPAWVALCARDLAAFGWVTLAHLAWAGAGVYVLVRSLGAGRAGAAVGAGCFAVSPYLVAHTCEGHYPQVWAVSWYPWAFWLFLGSRQGWGAATLAFPLVLAAAFLTGHPQEWYFLILTFGGWCLVDAISDWRGGRKRGALAALAGWVVLAAIGLALCAVELAPELGAQAWTLRRTAIPLRAINRYTLHTVNLFQLVSPFALGGPADYFGNDNYWETLFSIGLVPLILAIIGAARHPQRRARRWWVVLIAASLVFAVGRRLGLFALAYWLLPGINHFRVPSRTLFLASLGGAVLAGLGVDVLARGMITASEWTDLRRRWRWSLIVLTALLVIGGLLRGALGVPVVRPQPEVGEERKERPESIWDARGLRAWMNLSCNPALWGVVTAMAAIAFSRAADERSARQAGLALGVLALVELTVHAQRLLAVTPQTQVVADRPIADWLNGRCRERSGPLRVAASPRSLSDLDAVLLGIEKTNVNDSFQIQHAANLYERLYPFLEDAARPARPEEPMDQEVERFRVGLARSVLDRLGVGWVITPRATALDGVEGLTPVEHGNDAPHVLENSTRLPRCYVVPRVQRFEKLRAPPSVLLSQVDPREAVVLESDPLPEGERQAFEAGEWVSDDPDRVVIRVETAAPGLLVVASCWMPGWRAWVDGRPEVVLKGDFWQQTVPIRSAGRHEVVLCYDLPGRVAGLVVSGAGAGAWAMLGLAILRRGRKRAA